MDEATLTFWRDIALIVLFLEAIILALPLLILSIYAVRGLREVKARLAPPLREARQEVQRGEKATDRFSSALMRPVIEAAGLGAGLAKALAIFSERR